MDSDGSSGEDSVVNVEEDVVGAVVAATGSGPQVTGCVAGKFGHEACQSTEAWLQTRFQAVEASGHVSHWEEEPRGDGHGAVEQMKDGPYVETDSWQVGHTGWTVEEKQPRASTWYYYLLEAVHRPRSYKDVQSAFSYMFHTLDGFDRIWTFSCGKPGTTPGCGVFFCRRRPCWIELEADMEGIEVRRCGWQPWRRKYGVGNSATGYLG